ERARAPPRRARPPARRPRADRRGRVRRGGGRRRGRRAPRRRAGRPPLSHPMFASLARFGALHWKLVLGGTAAFAFVAWSAFRTLPIEAYPDVTDPMVEVVTLFPQQSAERVERQVTLEIERVLAGTPGLTNLRSVSVFGLSLVTLRFDEGTVDRENRAYVAERLREARLPEGAEAMLGPEATPVGQILRYTLVGPRSL